MRTFLLSLALLMPLAGVITNYPQPALLEIAGGVLALSWLAAQGQLLALRHVLPFLAAGVVYAACGYIAADRLDLVMYSHQMALLVLFYGLPAGLCLRRLAETERGDQVAAALLVFALGMAAIFLVILRLPEVQRITGESRGVFQRTNGDEDQAIVYLHFFSLTNIIIGVIPFTIFALAAIPAAMTTRSPLVRILACAGTVLAAYVNLLIATRTALLAAALSTALILGCALRRISVRRWLLFGAALAAPAAVAVLYFRQNTERFSYLLERFAEAGDDGRIEIWSEAAGLVLRFPAGQSAGKMQSHSWGHNLFLDVGLTNGWVAIAAVLAMFACVYLFVLRRLWRGNFFSLSANVILLGWLLATSLAGLLQPPQPAFLTVLHLACGFFAPFRKTAPRGSAGAQAAGWPHVLRC